MRSALFAILVYFLVVTVSFAANPKIIALSIKGPIGPATQEYFESGLAAASDQNASAVILTLDTPGGLESSMRNINSLILASPIPIISYVAPDGARAMSAGVYIMYASHVAMMAPSTTMGDATPVSLGMLQGADKTDIKSLSTSEQKMMQDAISYLKSLASLRGRNANWPTDAVLKSEAITAQDALKLHVIDDIAIDYADLLKKSNNRQVQIHGNIQTVKIDNADIIFIDQSFKYKLLTMITDPNIAYLLLLLAIYAIVIELSHPGLILPGFIGILSLVLSLYALQMMPLDYAGFSLLLLGVACMIAEIFITSFGIVAIIGLVSFVIGSFMLFDTTQTEYRVALWVIITMGVITAAFFLFLLNYLIKVQRRMVITGSEGLLYKEGTVINNEDGKLLVKILGDLWNAKSDENLKTGDLVRVKEIDGLVLIVETSRLKSPE